MERWPLDFHEMIKKIKGLGPHMTILDHLLQRRPASSAESGGVLGSVFSVWDPNDNRYEFLGLESSSHQDLNSYEVFVMWETLLETLLVQKKKPHACRPSSKGLRR